MDNTLRSLVDLRETVIQRTRIAFGNRLSAIERGADQAADSERQRIEHWAETFDELNKALDAEIAEEVKDIQIVQHMRNVKGIGPMLAAKIIAMIDISRSDTVSALWRYAGYAVVEGKREYPTKGQRLHYNTRLKSTLYLLAGSFLKSNSPYRRVYDDARVYYEANRPDWTKSHQHLASMRKMIKVFLSHLWERWRMLEGLPVRPLYVQERLGHEHYMDATEFGWPPISQ